MAAGIERYHFINSLLFPINTFTCHDASAVIPLTYKVHLSYNLLQWRGSGKRDIARDGYDDALIVPVLLLNAETLGMPIL
ncbi:hypothetical protein TUM12370_06550 [Salmonella enterica subsp. enterica serovar Choleraesuis]|nr:hypothetical protein TUM12370_06550 [Salmonella enterica subsp. enterica serovar Choleraesuis]